MPQVTLPASGALRGLVAPALLMLVAALARLPTLGQPLTEAHGFRQTQTAYTALIYHRQGIDLLRPELPVAGPPWLVPFEFPLVQAVGSLLMDIGISPDVAMRTLGLALHLLTGALLFGLTRRIAGEVCAAIALAAFLFCPFGMLWGRTSMIEFGATAASIGALWAGTAWLDSRRRWLFITAFAAATIAMLVKSSTAIWYLFPLLAWRPSLGPASWREPGIWILISFAVVAGALWTLWADSIKAATLSTASLTSSGLRSWYFGVAGDRFDLANWTTIIGRILLQMTGLAFFFWVTLGALHAGQLHQRRFLAALAAAGVLPIIVLMPVFTVHNYYLAAISPIVALAVGLGGTWLYSRRHLATERMSAMLIAGLWLIAFFMSDWWRIYLPVSDPAETLPAAAYVSAHSQPGETVVVLGRPWDPSVLYYADRRGFAAESTTLAFEDYDLVVLCPYGRACQTVPSDER